MEKLKTLEIYFSSTEEAVTYGQAATAHDIECLKAARIYYLERYRAVRDINDRIKLATLAQFCREAYEAKGG